MLQLLLVARCLPQQPAACLCGWPLASLLWLLHLLLCCCCCCCGIHAAVMLLVLLLLLVRSCLCSCCSCCCTASPAPRSRCSLAWGPARWRHHLEHGQVRVLLEDFLDICAEGLRELCLCGVEHWRLHLWDSIGPHGCGPGGWLLLRRLLLWRLLRRNSAAAHSCSLGGPVLGAPLLLRLLLFLAVLLLPAAGMSTHRRAAGVSQIHTQSRFGLSCWLLTSWGAPVSDLHAAGGASIPR